MPAKYGKHIYIALDRSKLKDRSTVFDIRTILDKGMANVAQ
jgi:hypothetical protein